VSVLPEAEPFGRLSMKSCAVSSTASRCVRVQRPHLDGYSRNQSKECRIPLFFAEVAMPRDRRSRAETVMGRTCREILPPPGHSIVLCCGTTMWCRTSPSQRPVRHAGTALATPICCQDMPSRTFPPRGGGIPREPRRLEIHGKRTSGLCFDLG